MAGVHGGEELRGVKENQCLATGKRPVILSRINGNKTSYETFDN